MRIFLLLAALGLTGALFPATYTIAAHNGRDGNPAALLMCLLCLLRGAVMMGTGLGFWAPFVMELACAGLLLFSIDPAVRAPFPVLFGILGFVVPVVVVAGAWMGRRNWVLAAVGVAVLARVGGWAAYGPLTAPWRTERMTSSIQTGVGSDAI